LEPESIAARYRHWNRDLAIHYALMTGEKQETPPGSPKKLVHGKGDGGAGGSGKDDVVRVVREIGGGAANWPMLTKTNCTTWALVMKVKMKARNLWEAIEPSGVS
jgi:hypothetical protein